MNMIPTSTHHSFLAVRSRYWVGRGVVVRVRTLICWFDVLGIGPTVLD